MARHSTAPRGRLCTRLGGFVLFGLSAATAALAQSAPASAPSAQGAPASEATVVSFLTALKQRDFASAASRFDATLTAALPADKLASVWDAQVGSLGKLTTWFIPQHTQVQGKDVFVVRMRLEQGELQALVAVTPETQQLAGLSFKPVPKATTVASYVRPASFQSVGVSVGSEPFVLKGTLSLPTGPGPFPAVVLVHGSGPMDRDESVGGNKPFKDIAEGLASRGVIVLRYDKRTFQYGYKLSNAISIDDEVVLDAVAAVKLLEARQDVDGRRVFVLGHSLGAQLAPEIAVRAKGVAGVILLAPPGRKPWDSLLAQMRYLEVPDDKLAEVEKAVERLKAGTLGDETLLGAPASYWNDWASRDGVAMAKKLSKPTLILRGERDYQVTEDDVATWRKGLQGLSNVEIVLLPGDNHLFVHESGKPGPAEYDVASHVDGAVIDKLAAFLLR